MSIYVVQPGNNIDEIALNYGVPVIQIIEDNQLVYPYELAVGQALLIRDGDITGSGREIISNGYAYPFISRWVLEQTLPYLSDLSVFSYGFTSEGELLSPLLDEQWMIFMAAQYGTRAILTLTPLGADGRFDNRLISAVVRNPQAQEKLLNELLAVMEEKWYRGLDIDFEYVLEEDRDYFTEFVRICTQVMHCLLYTSPSPRDRQKSRMPSSA